MDMTVKGQLTPRDWRAGAWSHMKPRPFFAALGVLIIALLLFGLYLSFFAGRAVGNDSYRWFLLAFLAFLLINVISIPIQLGRLFRQTKSLRHPYEYRITDESLSVRGEGVSGAIRWKDLVKWKEGNGVLLLYINDAQYYVVPHRFFATAADIEEFRQLLARIVV